MEKKEKQLRKRFLIAAILPALIFLITILSAPVSIEDLTKKTVVIKEVPVFSKKRNGNSNEYKIIISFKDIENKLEITGYDLDFADRKAIQSELNVNDTIEIKYHHIFIAQITKNGKSFMQPEKAIKGGETTEKFMFWLSLISFVICIVGAFTVELKIKYIGWLATILIIVVAAVLFLALGVHFSEVVNYEEFKELSTLKLNSKSFAI